MITAGHIQRFVKLIGNPDVKKAGFTFPWKKAEFEKLTLDKQVDKLKDYLNRTPRTGGLTPLANAKRITADKKEFNVTLRNETATSKEFVELILALGEQL